MSSEEERKEQERQERERRQHDRANTRMHFYFNTPSRRHEVGEVVVKNLSESGMLLIHRERIYQGTILEIEVDLHDGRAPERVSGQVVRCDQPIEDVSLYALGVKLVVASEGLREALREFVQAHLDTEPLEDMRSYLLQHYQEEINANLSYIQRWGRIMDEDVDGRVEDS